MQTTAGDNRWQIACLATRQRYMRHSFRSFAQPNTQYVLPGASAADVAQLLFDGRQSHTSLQDQ
jgi:hypothetical protein